MSSLNESHMAVHLRCFLCDHELPKTDGDAPPHPVVSCKSSVPVSSVLSPPNLPQSLTMDASTRARGTQNRWPS